MTTEQAKLDIYTDGSCAFCQWVRARIEPWDTHGRLRFLDYNDPAVAAATPYTLEQLDHEMHVRMPNGDWVAGFTAWAKDLTGSSGTGVAGMAFQQATDALGRPDPLLPDGPEPLALARLAAAMQPGALRDGGCGVFQGADEVPIRSRI